MKETNSCSSCFNEKEVSVLYEISLLMTHTMDIKNKINEALKILKTNAYLERSALFLKELDSDKLTVFASVDLTSQQSKMSEYTFGEGATGLAAQSKEPVVIEDIHKNITFLNKSGASSKDLISYVAVPLISNDKTIGVISANLKKHSKISFDDTIRMLTIVGSIFTQSIITYYRYKSEKEALTEKKNYYKEEVIKSSSSVNFESMVGTSKEMKNVFSLVKRIAPSSATVLIRGETGTGKELIATSIHNLAFGQDDDRPYIKLNCAAISETLLESELFGHEKGAFTDADKLKKGRFELADGGTLFLDEIGDISPNLQVKLLRIMQEQEFERVGGVKTIKVNVRLVTATNKNLEEMVANGEFREDLYYRLNVIPINLPPLRDRIGDIKLLLSHFLAKFNKENKKSVSFDKESLKRLQEYPWPGNIRELENTLERIVLISHKDDVDITMLNSMIPPLSREEFTKTYEKEVEVVNVSNPHKILTKKELEEIERNTIIDALNENEGVKSRAAKSLGLTVRQIGYKIKKYGIEL